MITIDLKEIFYEPNKSILKDVSFSVEAGKIVALLGPSGSGKSTILKIIGGIHKGYVGQISTGDLRVALIPQKNGLLPWRTVYENIVILKKLEHKKVDEQKALKLIESLGLRGLEGRYPAELSGGQYQRVVLGQSFFYEPDVLLMDEPFSALDVETKNDALAVFVAMQRERKITIVFVTHVIDEANAVNAEVVDLAKWVKP